MSEHVTGSSNMTHENSSVVELNVGGVFYSTSVETLKREPEGTLAKLFSDSGKMKAARDAKGKYFIDRDGVLFRYVLDYLRNLKLVLPENFHEKDRLRQEAEHYNLPNLVKMVAAHPSFRSAHYSQLPSLGHPQHDNRYHSLMSKHISPLPSTAAGGAGAGGSSSSSTQLDASSSAGAKGQNLSSSETLAPDTAGNATSTNNTPMTSASPSGDSRGSGCITVGYRGTFAFGRDGLADVKFRKLSRIIVCGKVSLCREVFKDTLNESRDPDRGDSDRYTSRFFLKHSFLEQAFDMLLEEGFELVASCGSGTNSAGEVKPGLDTEEAKWQHYNEFIFGRR
ncbi:BTB/POZ domain-containing protein KCTD12 [Aplysia californica]|uniref:BTB/POZ domain-containing protein KCTD12 n=1 Tax=Aplysia californica TaxID=6500 RepID=A0ABM0ZXJ1_APLCA|nr:BTB/POZ domain-containing protein KCTD12 [Aplysia californica]XP_012936550.1 BTB/POZ domain-containing protein KCTD12 [Aplysia californica]